MSEILEQTFSNSIELNFITFDSVLSDEDLVSISNKIYLTIITHKEISEMFYASLSLEHKILLCTKNDKIHNWLKKKDKRLRKMTEYIDLGEVFPNGPISARNMGAVISTFKPKRIKVIDYVNIGIKNPEDLLTAFTGYKFKEMTFFLYNDCNHYKHVIMKTHSLKIVAYDNQSYFYNLTVIFDMFHKVYSIEIVDCLFFCFDFEYFMKIKPVRLIIKNSRLNINWNQISKLYMEKNLNELIIFEYNIQKSIEKKEFPEKHRMFINNIFQCEAFFHKLVRFTIDIPHFDFDTKHFEILKTASNLRFLTLRIELHHDNKFFIKLKQVVEECFWIDKINLQTFCCCRDKNTIRSRSELNRIRKIFKGSKRYHFLNLLLVHK